MHRGAEAGVMPKINVYLPDDLAEAVRAAGIPVSAVCQRALEGAVRRVTAIRETASGAVELDVLAQRLPSFTKRTHELIRLATERATGAGAPGVGTGDLLAAIVAE